MLAHCVTPGSQKRAGSEEERVAEGRTRVTTGKIFAEPTCDVVDIVCVLTTGSRSKTGSTAPSSLTVGRPSLSASRGTLRNLVRYVL